MKYSLFLYLLLAASNAFSLKPEKDYPATPAQYNLSYQEVRIRTKDGVRLNAWVYQTDSTQRNPVTIILAGGDAGNMSYLISYAAGLLSAGYRVVSFDYRGFGQSDDFQISEDHLYYNEFHY